LINKISNFCSAVHFFKFLVIKTLDPNQEPDPDWPRKMLDPDQEDNESGSETLLFRTINVRQFDNLHGVGVPFQRPLVIPSLEIPELNGGILACTATQGIKT
jgi:hypothetical protein